MRFDPSQEGLRRWFGPLETEILEIVWDAAGSGGYTVRQVYCQILRTRQIAYTTVMTTMGRLAEKGVLNRIAHPTTGHAYFYTPRWTRQEFEDAQLDAVLAAVD
jgi:predicted transcriptional regulator